MNVQRPEPWERSLPRRRRPRLGRRGPRAALAALGGLVGLAGCAAGTGGTTDTGSTITVLTGDGVSYAVDRSPEMRLDQPVNRTPGEAWLALPRVYRALGFEVDTRVDSRRQLGTSQQRFSGRFLDRRVSDFFDCGTDPGLMRPLADQAPIDARVVTTVGTGSGGTAQLRTEVSGSARRTGGTAGRAECRSTGLLEVLIARMVEEPEG
jgi:hypothetical protein